MTKIVVAVIVGIIVVLLGGVFFLNKFVADSLTSPSPSVTATPSVTASPTASPVPTNVSIIVESPKANDQVSNPITVTGKARVFEQTFNYKLKNASNGQILVEGAAMSAGQELSEFNPFSFKIALPVNSPENLLLELIEYSAADGSERYKVSIPLKLTSKETMKVKSYFSKNVTNDCSAVSAVERTVLKTQEPAYISLTELLKGPTTSEKNAGFSTNIPVSTLPMNMRINSVRIVNGVATADFSGELESGVAGSCRVMAIRSQIENTLKQFSTVKSVVISINGRTDDILQP